MLSVIWMLFSKKLVQAFGFVLKYWKVFLFLGLLGAVYVQFNMIQTRNIQIVELNGKLEKCANANEMLANTLDNRNDEIKQWKEVSDKLQDENDKLVGTLTGIRTDTEDRAKEILKGPKPKSCKDSIQYLIDGVRELQW